MKSKKKYINLVFFVHSNIIFFLVPALLRMNLNGKPKLRNIDGTKNSGVLHFGLRAGGMTYKGCCYSTLTKSHLNVSVASCPFLQKIAICNVPN